METESVSKPRSRRAWGPETPAGLKVLEQIRQEAEQQEPVKKKRRSRWAPEVRAELPGLSGIALPASILALVQTVDSHVMQLQQNLSRVNQTIQLITQGNWTDERGPTERSPSPEPVYDHSGVRTNTRELRMRDKLMTERNDIIIELIKSCPSYKPPTDWRPPKKSQRLYIPVKEHPGYNFIGLIIGPRGTTQKDMEKKTGAKIAIRGKGSVKEGRQRKDGKREDDDDDELHVLITADTQEAVDHAAALIKPLLEPVDEERNEHKRAQLRELALMNGTLRDPEDTSKLGLLAGESNNGDMYQLPETMKEAAQQQYQRDIARVHGEEHAVRDDEYKAFLAELGGNGPPGVAPAHTAQAQPLQPEPDRRYSAHRPGIGAMPHKDIAKLFVGYIPHDVHEATLHALFQQYGTVHECQIIYDRDTGASRGFGFVAMGSEQEAAECIRNLDGYSIGGKRLIVRVKDSGNKANRSEAGAAFQPPHSQPDGALPGPPPLAPGPQATPYAPVSLPEHWNEAPPGVEPEDDPSAFARPEVPSIGPSAPPCEAAGAPPASHQPPLALYPPPPMPSPVPAMPLPAYPPAALPHMQDPAFDPAAEYPPGAEDLPPGEEDLPPGVEPEERPAAPGVDAAAAAGISSDNYLYQQYSYDGAAPQASVAPEAAPAETKANTLSAEEQRKAAQRQRAQEEQNEAGESRRARLLAAAAAAALQSAPPPPPRKAAPPPKPPPKKPPKEAAPEPSESGELVCSDDDEDDAGSRAPAVDNSRDFRPAWRSPEYESYDKGYAREGFRGGQRPSWGDRVDRRFPPRSSRGGWV